MLAWDAGSTVAWLAEALGVAVELAELEGEALEEALALGVACSVAVATDELGSDVSAKALSAPVTIKDSAKDNPTTLVASLTLSPFQTISDIPTRRRSL